MKILTFALIGFGLLFVLGHRHRAKGGDWSEMPRWVRDV